jgi:thiosulfate/3-mercaptopyruvate sulfurtransferase
MEKKVIFVLPALIFFVTILLSGQALGKSKPSSARSIDPIVSTDWLFANLNEENLVILDIRSPGEYEGGHISGSINEPFVTGFDPSTGPTSKWIVGGADGLWLEVPQANDLLKTIGDLGITNSSRVVIVTAPNPGEPPFYGLANATRVALTLIYAGVKNVAILDGGYPKWVEEEKLTTEEVPVFSPTIYKGKVNKAIFVSRQYVKKNLRNADIVDARDADVYYGATIEFFADKEGHIPSAKCLPSPFIWDLITVVDEEQTPIYSYYGYKQSEILAAMASGVLREPWGYKAHKNQEIIVYCGVGGYASSWWFVLTQVLGYENVKLYDGSAQEWVRYYVMVPYQWD